MKLFGEFDAIKFPEENLIFITKSSYLYYIYDPKYKYWRKHKNAGNDYLTVSNYPSVYTEELMAAMGGMYPKKETDIMRLCNPSQLCIRDMLDLLNEDYPQYMSDWSIRNTAHYFLLESNITFKSYVRLRELFEHNLSRHADHDQALLQIKELSFEVLGRDIFKKEIGIVDGHDGSSYFWIQPVRVIDYTDTNDSDNVAEMSSAEISIEESDVYQYLTPFLYKYFDGELEANKKRVDDHWSDDDNVEHFSYVSKFEWYLTHNFFTFDSVRSILKDICDTIDALSSGGENEFTVEIKGNSVGVDLIIDFYHRFIYRMEYMLKVGEEKGYNLISFMGP